MMNPILIIILAAVTIASAAVLPPALPLDLPSNPTLSSETSILTPSLLQAPNSTLSLQSLNLPDDRFEARISIDGPLLPINSALINILYFMSIVAAQDAAHQLQPRTYSTANYRDVQIKSYAWTEARYLLWAMYYAAVQMVKYSRFNDIAMELYWEDERVGLVKIAVKRTLSLAGQASNLTLDLGDHIAHTNLTSSGEDVMQPKSVVGNMTDSDLAPLIFSDLNASTPFSLPPIFAVSFMHIAGASRLDRNEVFLTFYTALLQVAQFPPEGEMRLFSCVSPSGNVQLHLQSTGIGCQVSHERSRAAIFSIGPMMTE